MLARYHVITAGGFVLLGIVGGLLMPSFALPVPWTVLVMFFVAMGASALLSFAGAARYVSPIIVLENRRFSRYPQPIRYTSDRLMSWAFVPCKGWDYGAKWLNSMGNPAVVMLPSCLLERDATEDYLIGRCKVWLLSVDEVAVLTRKRVFAKILADMGHTPEHPLEVYMGFHSTTIRTDASHKRSGRDLNAFARSLSATQREYMLGAKEQADKLDHDIEVYQRLRNADAMKTVVRNEMRKEDQDR